MGRLKYGEIPWTSTYRSYSYLTYLNRYVYARVLLTFSISQEVFHARHQVDM